MFNTDASDQDRQKKLEELIRKNDDDDDKSEDKESEIPNFEMINEMLARSEDEIVLFNKMDQEMGEREGKEERMKDIMANRPGIEEGTFVNYRLIQEWEVPEWIKVKKVEQEDETKKILGKRVRKNITNLDNLSDQQFMKAIEEGEDLEEVKKRVNKRREERIAEGGPAFSDEEELEDQEEYANSSLNRKKEKKTASELMQQVANQQESDIIQDNFEEEGSSKK